MFNWRFMENVGKGNIISISSIYGVVGNEQRIYKATNLDESYGNIRIKKSRPDLFSCRIWRGKRSGDLNDTMFDSILG